MKKNKKFFSAIDLYCGCGGVTEGLKQAGFSVVAAVDNDQDVCKTYKANHPEVSLYEKDIKLINPNTIRKNVLKGKKLDLMVVCAPCQPFSNLNKSEKYDDRIWLILEAVRFAKILKPAMIFFENVPGITRYDEVLNRLREGLFKLGYILSNPIKVDASDYEVPQRRNRCVMIATKGIEPPVIPQPITPEGSRVTVRQVIAGLKRLRAKEKDENDFLHFARDHKDITLRRLRSIPCDGGSRTSLPPELQLECHKKCDGFPDVYGRMAWDDVAPTLTTGCTDVTKGRYAHPEQDRAISLREAALLQTFPIYYKFVGKPTCIEAQIGNAVPVNLIKAFSPLFKDTIRRVINHELYKRASGSDKLS